MTLEYETLHCKDNTFILFTGLDNIKYSLIIVIYTNFQLQITFFKLKSRHLTSF